MQISHISSEYTSKSLKREFQVKKPSEVGRKPLFSTKDSVVLSEKPEGLNPARLAELKKRVSSGFYMRQSVTDDISDKMSGMFDDMTE